MQLFLTTFVLILCSARGNVTESNDELRLCGEPPDQYYTRQECDKKVRAISRIGSCPRNTVQVSTCNGNGVFCSGFQQGTGIEVPGICENGVCCARRNPGGCMSNQGLSIPLTCDNNQNCPQLTPCDTSLGYCCMHRTRINGLCPQGYRNGGACASPGNGCSVPGASFQGTCTNNYVCCISSNGNSAICPTGSTATLLTCNANADCVQLGGTSVCSGGRCCAYNRNMQTCTHGGRVVRNSYCQVSNACRQYGNNAYCDITSQRCCVSVGGTCPIGYAETQYQCASNQDCIRLGSASICQGSYCCAYNNALQTCSNGGQSIAGSYCNNDVSCLQYSSNSYCDWTQGVCCQGSSSTCPSGSAPTGVQCNTNVDCVQFSQNAICSRGVCCAWSQADETCSAGGRLTQTYCNNDQICLRISQSAYCDPSLQMCCSQDTDLCPSGTISTGYQCISNSDCYQAGVQSQCYLGQCCQYSQSVCSNGGQPMYNSYCQNDNMCAQYGTGLYCDYNQEKCCSKSNGGGGSCPVGTVSTNLRCTTNTDCFQGISTGLCYNFVCCAYSSVSTRCSQGGQVLQASYCNSESACLRYGTGAYCDYNQQKCCSSSSFTQCPVGYTASGVTCASNNNCYRLGANSVCRNQQCCISQSNGGFCSAGGQIYPSSYCSHSAMCRQYGSGAYCDVRQQKCCSIASLGCSSGEVASGGQCSGTGTRCGSQGTCRNGVCCEFQCKNGQFTGQVCQVPSQCHVASYQQVATCEHQHCCTNMNNYNYNNNYNYQPSDQCPFGTVINYNQRCASSAQCSTTGSYCVGGYCCDAKQSGLNTCARYGMIATGETCYGNTNICASRTRATAVCYDGQCCTVSRSPAYTSTALGFCYNGELAQYACVQSSDCPLNMLCVNGVCCTKTGQEWKYACGGVTAVASCYSAGICNTGLSCISPNYCCECEFGQAGGSCTQGCQAGYTCSRSQFCCPSCVNGARPVGSCFEGQCGANARCQPGNICCPI